MPGCTLQPVSAATPAGTRKGAQEGWSQAGHPIQGAHGNVTQPLGALLSSQTSEVSPGPRYP